MLRLRLNKYILQKTLLSYFIHKDNLLALSTTCSNIVYVNFIMTVLAHLQKGAQKIQQILKSPQNFCRQNSVCFESSFVPRRVLILTKISRYQIEKYSYPHLDEDQLKDLFLARGINYDAVLAGHHANKNTELRTVETLRHFNIPYRIRDRYNIDNESIDWADLVVSVGGDGTFLLASNLINKKTKPIIGINSDPEFSEGFLMLVPKYTNNINDIFEKLKAGNFRYLMRSRIRTTLYGDNIWQTPFHMHGHNSPTESKNFYVNHYEKTKPKGELPKIRQLPWLALNEVFIGETLSARISTLHINIENDTFKKVKSSGICVTTGTGSSSWYRAINSLNPEIVKDILSIAGCKKLPLTEELKKICFEFNSKLQYPADELKIGYVIRDMIVKHTWPLPKSIDYRGFCDKLIIRSQCYDGGLVIDGGIAVQFNVGTTTVLQSLEEDRLCNIVLSD